MRQVISARKEKRLDSPKTIIDGNRRRGISFARYLLSAQDSGQRASNIPPMTDLWARQVFQFSGEFWIGVGMLRVKNDGRRAEQLQPGFPQIICGLVALDRRLGIERSPIQPRQRLRQSINQRFVRRGWHEHKPPRTTRRGEQSKGVL